MTLQEKFDSIMNSIESLVGVGEEDIPNAVAREVGLNLRQLADSFQFMTDMTLIKYIRRRRLVHALDTRIALGLPVEEVVSIAGFSDAAAFSKACKNEFDLSPAQIDRDVLCKYAPLSFALVSSGKNADQMENGTLITTMKENTICGISVSQFATVKQMLEISALYGFNDEETEFVYRLSEMEEITVKQAADFFEDFRMKWEDWVISTVADPDTEAVKNRMEKSKTRKIKLVPHRGWHRGILRIFSTVSSLPDSTAKIVLCSAP